MPPVSHSSDDLKILIEEKVKNNNVMIFSKSTCPFCIKVKELLKSHNVEYAELELDQLENGAAIQGKLLEITGQRTVPNVFVKGNHIGGHDDTMKAYNEHKLLPMIQASAEESYDYDLVVIGGGSGGLAASKEAATQGFKVACLDFVKPSPQGTTWGLGGTCVNVGCIPKKLMHQAAILGHSLEDAKLFGWNCEEKATHNWEKLRNAVQDYIGSLNWKYRVDLRNKAVKYINSYGHFIGPHKIQATNKKGKVEEITSKYFIIATGGRPKYPEIPGIENVISSDDLFSLPYSPGKTVVIGASYVALECAGFLAALGCDVTVMVRSILLRGFDQQCAEKIGEYMTQHNVTFLRPCVPAKIEKLEDGKPGKYLVSGKKEDGSIVTIECNTVLMAVGREPCTKDLGLDKVGVEINPKSGFIKAGDKEQTTCSYVYAIGDVIEGRPELTPVAIQAGRLLARRLFANASLKCDYDKVPTTVFTPLEYGAIGLSEEDAITRYGENNIEVYHSNFWPLEWTVAHREENACYAKLVCVKSENERVVGLHILGPNAGEITQGFTVGMKMGATKQDFDNSIGIHPTCAETFTTLNVTKSSGQDSTASGC